MTKINSIEAAKIEASGDGVLSVEGRSVVLKTNNGLVYCWHCATERQAREHLRLFRSSLKWAA